MLKEAALGVLCLLVWLSLSVGVAGAAPGWAPMKPLGAGFEDRMAADMTPSGSATVAWRGTRDGHQAILAASGATSGTFTAPVMLSRGAGDVGVPTLGVSAGDAAVAAWAQRDTPTTWVVWAAVRSGGRWSAPEPLSGPTADPPNPAAAIADDGTAMVVWLGTLGVGETGRVQLARRPPGGAWSEPDQLNDYYAAEPLLVMDAQGHATAAWLQRPSQAAPPSRVMVTTRTPGAAADWTEPQQVGDGSAPHLAVGANGTAGVIWQTGPTVQAALHPRGGAWTGAEDTHLPGGSYPGERPQIGLDGSGTAFAISGLSGFGVRTNLRPAGGAWGATPQIASTAYYTDNYWPALAVNRRGVGLIGYLGIRDATPMDPGTPLVHAALRQPGTAWAAPLTIANPGGATAIAVDEAGDGLVTWATHTGTVYARGYDVTPPRLEGLTVPARGVADRPLDVAVRPADSWSALGLTTWDFGDGTTAVGTAQRHAYAAPGRYTVTVRSQDALGNAAATTRRVEIAPGPPRMTLEEARFTRAKFEKSILRRKARLRIEGRISAPLRVSIRLTGPVRPAGERGTVNLGTVGLAAGAFDRAVRLRRARLLPGRYEVEITGAGLATVTAPLRLRAPRDGVVMAHRMSTTRTRRSLRRVTRTTVLWAIFKFPANATARSKLRLNWYAPGQKRPVDSLAAGRDLTLIRSSWDPPDVGDLARGRWRAVLKAGKRVVDSVSIRIG